jgi:Kef-type K+ transport system membrane component KefB
VAMLMAWQAGLDGPQAFVAASALTGCSVGLAHSAWKSYPLCPDAVRQLVLQVMVALEMLSIVVMAVGTTALKEGLSWWILVRLLGIAVAVYALARYATHLVAVFQRIIERTTHWRLHWLALLILAICAVGQRLGLDGAKTAFVLGLCMSRAKHQGMNLEDYMAPLSQRFLIPIFFVSLGLNIEWRMLVGLPAALALGTAGLLLGVREILHRRWLPSGGAGPVFLLLSPNLTLAALAASALIEHGQAPAAAAWLLLTGLFVTVPAIALLPARPPGAPPPASGMPSIAAQAQPEELKERHEEWTTASIGPTRQ